MKKARIFGVVVGILLAIISISSVFSTVEVFSKFDTVVKINENDTVEINKSLSLKNVYDVGIVPGQVEFKIGDGDADSVFIEEAVAVDSYGNDIKATIKNREGYSVIVLDVYYPLLPGFEYSFDLYYRFSYEPGGIFFKSLQIPVRESTIPIEDGYFQVILPESYSFTYLSDEGFNETEDGVIAKWNIKDDSPKMVGFEYSYLPVNLGFARGSYVFWIALNILLLLFLILEIRKAVKRIRAEYGEE